jgi:hypothetical protein
MCGLWRSDKIEAMVTYEEWLTMPTATNEVVNGVVRVQAPPRLLHAPTVERLSGLIGAQSEATIGDSCSGVADIPLFDGAGTVRLAIEVLAPEKKRHQVKSKLADLVALGVPEVWILSPEARTVEILLLENGFLRRSQILADGILQPKLFPHVHVDIAKIWPD